MYGSCAPAAVNVLSSQISQCVTAVVVWMKSTRLQLNPDKTEVLCCATSHRQHQLPMTAMLIDGLPVVAVCSVRNLGIYINGDLSMRTHVQRTTSCCFAALHQLRQIRRLVSTSTFITLTVALINQRLDYGNSTLVGIPTYLVRRMKSALNAASKYS